MANLYIIAGCNGAGKTTASYTILPEILECKEFVNADIIAAGLSPFNVEGVALEAGRIMLSRIHKLIEEKADFAFETTLATRSYVSLIKEARAKGYKIVLVYFWLDSPDQAIKRVAKRVAKRGHYIPDDIVIRRYYRGLYNLIHLYTPIGDRWVILDNMKLVPQPIVKRDEFGETVFNDELWDIIKRQSDEQY